MNKTIMLSTLLLVLVAGCRTAKLNNPEPVPAADSLSATRAAILAGMDNQSWAVADDEPGKIEAVKVMKGRHEMHVAFLYDDKQVSMKYVDSKKLSYSKDLFGTEHIHNNYNVWTADLWWDVTRKLQKK